MNMDFFTKTDGPLIMGIVNVTPDSFSDGGQYANAETAVSHGLKLLEQGADILDVGGESTRPNAAEVSVEEEVKRVVPVIEGLQSTKSVISIDSRNAETIQCAIGAGANLINDVSALSHDVNSLNVAASCSAPICLMHMRGKPETMQENPVYGDVVDEICAYFEDRMELCTRHGIDVSRLILDPGIGFGKTVDHNLDILKNIRRFKSLGCPVLIGASRKSFIGEIVGETHPQDRLGGSLAVAIYAAEHGADILRVHDVAQTVQALKLAKVLS